MQISQPDFLTHFYTQTDLEQERQLKRIIKAVEEVFHPLHLFANQQLAELVHLRKGFVPFWLIFQHRNLQKLFEELGCRAMTKEQCLVVGQLLLKYIPKYSKALRVNPSGVRLLRCCRKQPVFEVYFECIDFSCFDCEWFQALLATKCDIYQIKYHKEEESALVYTNDPASLLKLGQELDLDPNRTKETKFRVRKAEDLERFKEFANRVGDVCERQSSNIKGFPCLKKVVKKKIKSQGKKTVVQVQGQLKFRDYGQFSNYLSCQKTEDGNYLVRVEGEYDNLSLSSQGEQEEGQLYDPL